MTFTHLQGALAWYDAGCATVPVVADGSKRPFGRWKDFQTFAPRRKQVEEWFKTAPEQGVGIICGKVSENLEMTEIEAARMGSEFLDRVTQAMADQDVDILWNRLIMEGYTESTPSGGMHILYRIEDMPVPGNTKIAMSADHKQTFAETRGEGGFVVVAPTGGRVHQTGESWSVLSGKIGEIPTITWNERCKIHEALRVALDERVLPTYERPAGLGTYDRANGDRPGDAFNDDPSISIHDILLRNGWKYLGLTAGQERYVHPLSSNMSTHSACTGHKGSPNLYAWSGMPREDYYTKFGVLAELEFSGDYSAAGRFLRAEGYGTQGEGVLDISDWFTSADDQTGVGQPVEPTTQEPGTVSSVPLILNEWSETGMAHLCVKAFGDRFRHVSEEMGWRIYRNGIWSLDKRSAVNDAVEKATLVPKKFAAEQTEAAEASGDKDEILAARRLQGTVNAFRSARGVNAITGRFAQQRGIACEVADFDHDRDLLCLDNGTFDLKTMKLRDHQPADMLTKRIALRFDESATCPGFLKFMQECIPDPEYREFLRRALAMTLLGRVREAAFLVLHGPTGCGKSQFVKIAHALLGEYAATAASGTFRESRNRGSNDPHDLHDLRGTRMASMSETSEGDVLNEELLKRITGGDTVKTRALYQSHIEWKPEFTVWVATNFLPNLNVSDDAIWRRVNIVNFPNQFKGDKAEIGIAERLIATELPGIFNWLLEGVEDYRAVGLKQPGSMAEKLSTYRDDIDPVTQFLAESLDEGVLVAEAGATISSSDLYRTYVDWASNSGIRFPMGQRKFSNAIDKRGYGVLRGAGNVRHRVGLKRNPTGWLIGR